MAEYILFDFDGTIFDTSEGIVNAVKYAMRKRGIEPDTETCLRFIGPPLQGSFARYFGMEQDDCMRAIADFREFYVPVGLYQCSVFPGLRELLADLRAAGKKLAVATSKPVELAETLLAREGLDIYFDAVCGTVDPNSDNEKWEIVERALAQLGAEGDNTLLVGDTQYDVYGAHRCALRCVGVRYGFAAAGELENSGADFIVDDPAALKELLLSADI